uniref:Uncharacterized protein n=1 Tax=Lynx canadensis TaxID=61383 RepID=A0A667GGJ2_LYNCA
MTFVTKSHNWNLIIFFNKIQTTIVGYRAVIFFFFFFFLVILDQLDSDMLPDGRIWLFGFNLYFSQHNSVCMGSASKRVGLQGCAQMGLLVLFTMPLLIPSVAMELLGSMKTMTFAHSASAMGLSKRTQNLFLIILTVLRHTGQYFVMCPSFGVWYFSHY